MKLTLIIAMAIIMAAPLAIVVIPRVYAWFRSLPHRLLRALDGNYNAQCMRTEFSEDADYDH